MAWQVCANGCEDGIRVSRHPIQNDSNLETTLSCKVVGGFFALTNPSKENPCYLEAGAEKRASGNIRPISTPIMGLLHELLASPGL